ncbi:MAG: leucine--tRNA ligase [Deltaproteobacteria bacterium]|nr:leucine--tRNA ligase [Deltaproteobacteria bacterium]
MSYPFKEIEPKWQKIWAEKKIFETKIDPHRNKYYVLDMFPYPSGAGLHVGHVEGYTASDIMARFKRQKGFSVLHPMGWDALGLPAERAAVREGRHPEAITKENIANFKKQLKLLGFSYDWSREICTSDPDYYKWTQWIFLKLYEKNLAYLAEVPVNWCPALGTVLANEEVQDGKYVETGDPVERKKMRQWMLKITAFADRLLKDLDTLDWPHGIIEMQRQWIGYSEGAEVTFAIDNSTEQFTVFTTRPDTLFGATYCVFAPEHPLINKLTPADKKNEVEDYVNWSKNRSDLDRQIAAEKEKTGVFTGAYAINPVNQSKIPIWIADYVLMSYGTGAIMAVPAHDERDHAFATKFNLPIVQVISAPEGFDIKARAWTETGNMMNSGDFNGLPMEQGIKNITAWLEKNSIGKKQSQYKLRDWLFSRQRYWGEPFPILYDETGQAQILGVKDLPVTLPFIEEFRPTDDGQPPLARNQEWIKVTRDGRHFTRETNTMPQWAGSCWYYLRFMDPSNKELPVGKEAEKFFGPVDLYIGGAEHAVLHLLYARFWHKVLYDCGLVSTLEPFQKLFNQGMIVAYSYRDNHGKYYSPEAVEERGKDAWFVKGTETRVNTQIEKMSKSRLNVVNPNDVVANYGADALRVYEMFMGPLERDKPWSQQGLVGVSKFLAKVWRLIHDDRDNVIVDNAELSETMQRLTHRTIKKVTQDIEAMAFNTAISQMMIFVNTVNKEQCHSKKAIAPFIKCLSPFAPHIAEEIWNRMGEAGLVSTSDWPVYDEALAKAERVSIAIQVNGKTKKILEFDADTEEDAVLCAAKEVPFIKGKLAENSSIRKVIFVKNRILNLIMSS